MVLVAVPQVHQGSHHRSLKWSGAMHVLAYVGEQGSAQLNGGIRSVRDISHPGGVPASCQNGLLVIAVGDRMADPPPVQQQRVCSPCVR